MPRRSTSPAPKQPANLTAAQKRTAIPVLLRQIEKLRNFDVRSVNSPSDPQISVQSQAIDTTLVNIFGHDTIDYERYQWASLLYSGGMYFEGRGPSLTEIRQELEEGKQKAIAILEGIMQRLKEELTDVPEEQSIQPPKRLTESSRRIFLVHGHDEAGREAIARFVEKIGFEAIILHEQANQGRTIIEKVEAHSDVGFAVVLLTPDDKGCKAGGDLQPRPRQNVLLELGYFIGRLGRARVCALKHGEMELPTDFAGIVWEPFELMAGGWKTKLGKELEAAGFEIDWNKVMRS
jgi:predicted nucleotide-binding protein